METRRTHDSLYLNESRYENTKRLFEFIVNKSINKGQNDSITSICDVGCAAGEFLYYLNSLSDNYNLTGLDVMKELLDKSKKYVPNATYVQGSVMDEYNFLENQFDITSDNITLLLKIDVNIKLFKMKRLYFIYCF